MSGETVGATRALKGFAMAALGLGLILVVIRVALAGLDLVGGPDLHMPERLLQSGGALVLVGLVTSTLLRARTEKEQA